MDRNAHASARRGAAVAIALAAGAVLAAPAGTALAGERDDAAPWALVCPSAADRTGDAASTGRGDQPRGARPSYLPRVR